MKWVARLKERAKDIKEDTYALYLASKDRRVPWYAKALLVLVVAYALSPIDLIPDFIPVIGYLDDLIIVPLGLALVIKLVPPEVLADCRERAREIDERAPSSVAGLIIITAIWLLGLVVLGQLVYRVASPHWRRSGSE